MSLACSKNFTQQLIRHQKGAIFLIMIAIITVGVIATLIGALSKVGLQNARNLGSSDLLAQAKEAVMGYAANGSGASQRPGDLMRPDVAHESTPDYDGTSDGCLNVNNAPSGLPLSPAPAASDLRCLGRLPWKNYGLSIQSPSENDPLGVMPWYAVSSNLFDYPATPLNSELLNKQTGWLTVRDMNGNVLSDRVVFILIQPGPPINGQSRPASPLGSASEYLESITVSAGCTAPCVPGTYSNADMRDEANTADNNFGFIMGDEHRWIDDPDNPGTQIEDSTYNFNDKLIYVTIDDLMPLIEKRIAREVKNCLDAYALTGTSGASNKYPWAAPISPLGYTSTPNTRFGRIPDEPIALISGTPTTVQLDANNATGYIKTMLDAMAALQIAVDNCGNIGSTSTTRAALIAAGAALESAANTVADNQPTTPAIGDNTVTDFAITAGERAQTISSPSRCKKIYNAYHGLSGSSTSVQTNLANANSGLVGIMVETTSTTQEDNTMASSWPTGCFVSGNMAGYWDQWKSLVFYQVSDNYRPQSSGVAATACGVTGTCLSISGNGNPNAGSGSYRAAVIMPGKKISTQTRATQTVDQYLEGIINTNASSSLTFETHKPSDADYSTVNDLILCVDGGNNCK